MKSGALVVRPWEAGDFERLAVAASGLSLPTLYLRFRAGMPGLPATYLRSTRERWPQRWDAVAAFRDDELVGWAEFGRYADDPHRADVGMCVVDAEQGHGVGTALASALLELVRASGVAAVHADIEPDNRAARRVWQRTTGLAAGLDWLVPPAPALAPALATSTSQCAFQSVSGAHRDVEVAGAWAGGGTMVG